jgi:hypothetical protein
MHSINTTTFWLNSFTASTQKKYIITTLLPFHLSFELAVAILFMATSPSSATMLFLVLLLLAFLDMANSIDYNAQPSSQWPLPSLSLCNCPKQNETRLQMYLHQYPALPSVPKPNEVGVISSTQPIGFGQTYVDDWFLTKRPDPNQNIIGRAQGYHIQTGQTVTSWYTSHIFVFQDDW